jgi:DNA ligase (NAD+)
MGDISAGKLVAAIQASKQQPLSRVLTGLGVRMTGRSMSRRLARHFGTMQALLDASVDDLQQVEGIGPERAVTIAAELVDLTPVIAKLTERGVNMTEPGIPTAEATSDGTTGAVLPLQKPDGTAMTVVVTGSVPGLTRDEGNEAVEALGGKSSGSVSTRTDLVVVGDGAGSKADKAAQREHDVQRPRASLERLLVLDTRSYSQTGNAADGWRTWTEDVVAPAIGPAADR